MPVNGRVQVDGSPAVKRYSIFDQSVTFLSYIFYSLPTFWLGLILIYLFGVTLRILPTQGIIDSRQGGGTFVRSADTEALVCGLRRTTPVGCPASGVRTGTPRHLPVRRTRMQDGHRHR